MTLKHRTVTLPINQRRTYTQGELISMGLEKVGKQHADLASFEILEYGARTVKMVLWF